MALTSRSYRFRLIAKMLRNFFLITNLFSFFQYARNPHATPEGGLGTIGVGIGSPAALCSVRADLQRGPGPPLFRLQPWKRSAGSERTRKGGLSLRDNH